MSSLLAYTKCAAPIKFFRFIPLTSFTHTTENMFWVEKCVIYLSIASVKTNRWATKFISYVSLYDIWKVAQFIVFLVIFDDRQNSIDSRKRSPLEPNDLVPCFMLLLKYQKNIKRQINIPSNAPRKITRIFRWSRRRAHSSSILSVRLKITYRSRMISYSTDLVYVQSSLFSSFFYIHSSELCFLILN